MKKIEIVKREIENLEKKGLFWICEHFGSLYLETTPLASLDDFNKIGEIKTNKDKDKDILNFLMSYPYDFYFFENTKKFQQIIKKAKEEEGKTIGIQEFSYEYYVEEFLFLEDISWSKDTEYKLKKETIKLIQNLISIAFLENKIIPNLTKLGFRVNISAHEYMSSMYLSKVKSGEIKINKDLEKLWDAHLSALEDIKYNMDIIENFPEKAKELKDISLDLEDFTIV